MPLPHTATKHQASSHIRTITFSYFIYTRVLTSSIPPVVHTTLPATTCQPAYWLSVASQKWDEYDTSISERKKTMAEAANGTLIRVRPRCTALGLVIMYSCHNWETRLTSGYLELSRLNIKEGHCSVFTGLCDTMSWTEVTLLTPPNQHLRNTSHCFKMLMCGAEHLKSI